MTLLKQILRKEAMFPPVSGSQNPTGRVFKTVKVPCGSLESVHLLTFNEKRRPLFLQKKI